MSRRTYTPDELSEVLRLHKLWLQGKKEGVRAYLEGANLEGAYLAGAYLEGAYLEGANLEGANLEGAYLVRANLVRANLVRANLEGANLEGAYLVRANLVRANLVRANLVRANLAGANLVGAYLEGANLVRAYLEGANLEGAYLVRAYLEGANLEGANLEGAYLVRANLEGANLEGAYGFKPFICVGPIGSRQAYTTVWLTEDKIQCGCFTGTLEAFEAKVCRTHADNPLHKAEYLGLVAYAKTLREAQPVPPVEEAAPPVPFQEGNQVRLSEAGRNAWPWAPTAAGEVRWCRGGWTRVEFDDCYLSFPDVYLEVQL